MSIQQGGKEFRWVSQEKLADTLFGWAYDYSYLANTASGQTLYGMDD